MNAIVFVILYVLFMLPTYYLPYLGSNSALVASLDLNEVNQAFLLHLGALIILVALAWYRGNVTNRQWLIVFPFLAGVFDMVPGLSFIPLIPTVMHLFAVVVGAMGGATTAAMTEEKT